MSGSNISLVKRHDGTNKMFSSNILLVKRHDGTMSPYVFGETDYNVTGDLDFDDCYSEPTPIPGFDKYNIVKFEQTDNITIFLTDDGRLLGIGYDMFEVAKPKKSSSIDHNSSNDSDDNLSSSDGESSSSDDDSSESTETFIDLSDPDGNFILPLFSDFRFSDFVIGNMRRKVELTQHIFTCNYGIDTLFGLDLNGVVHVWQAWDGFLKNYKKLKVDFNPHPTHLSISGSLYLTYEDYYLEYNTRNGISRFPKPESFKVISSRHMLSDETFYGDSEIKIVGFSRGNSTVCYFILSDGTAVCDKILMQDYPMKMFEKFEQIPKQIDLKDFGINNNIIDIYIHPLYPLCQLYDGLFIMDTSYNLYKLEDNILTPVTKNFYEIQTKL